MHSTGYHNVSNNLRRILLYETFLLVLSRNATRLVVAVLLLAVNIGFDLGFCCWFSQTLVDFCSFRFGFLVKNLPTAWSAIIMDNRIWHTPKTKRETF